ncbi:hypothetical protein [Erwinia psidii]|uniref:hypothetical protein n=1 Tax=Erwinia psidii TaxID=69224 RepID=UPI001F383160|nr:hypothetical protein [Erwinia psidii]
MSAACRLPPAACRLSPVACRLPLANLPPQVGLSLSSAVALLPQPLSVSNATAPGHPSPDDYSRWKNYSDSS